MKLNRSPRFALILLAAVALGYGCFERELKPVNPCTTSQQTNTIQVTSVDTVDLLIMVDNSSSMTEHQIQLRDQMPRMITTLVTGVRDMAHGGPFTPPRSLHIGVVSSTMGLGPVTGVPGCPAGFGDDGILFTRSPFPQAPCTAMDFGAMYPHGVFNFTRGQATPTAAQFSSDVSCVAVLGTGGCGLEYELEPALKALAPTPDGTGLSTVTWTAAGYMPPVFYGGTFGHGSDPATNGNFLRPNSALAILILCDEDDGSTANYEIFGTDPMYNSVALNVRPVAFADRLYPVSRYVDGFIGLRRTPSLLIFSAITGIPNALSPAPGMAADLDRIIADPTMQPMIDPAHPERLVPVCMDTAGGQTAVPGLRIVQVARGLAQRMASVSVHSICQNDFTPAVDDIINKISMALSGACLTRALNPDANGNVNCDVLELLPPDGDMIHCSSLQNPTAYTHVRDEVTMLADGTRITRELCRIRQVGRMGAGTMPGWAYDDGNAALPAGFSMLPPHCGQRVGFSVISPVDGAEVRLQCDETILPGSGSVAQLGAFCDPATGNVGGPMGMACTTGTAIAGNPMHLGCDSFARSCEIPCTTDADCTGAGLLSYVCDTRTATAYFAPSTVPMSTPPIMPGQIHHFCVNPTCGSAAATAH